MKSLFIKSALLCAMLMALAYMAMPVQADMPIPSCGPVYYCESVCYVDFCFPWSDGTSGCCCRVSWPCDCTQTANTCPDAKKGSPQKSGAQLANAQPAGLPSLRPVAMFGANASAISKQDPAMSLTMADGSVITLPASAHAKVMAMAKTLPPGFVMHSSRSKSAKPKFEIRPPDTHDQIMKNADTAAKTGYTSQRAGKESKVTVLDAAGKDITPAKSTGKQ